MLQDFGFQIEMKYSGTAYISSGFLHIGVHAPTLVLELLMNHLPHLVHFILQKWNKGWVTSAAI